LGRLIDLPFGSSEGSRKVGVAHACVIVVDGVQKDIGVESIAYMLPHISPQPSLHNIRTPNRCASDKECKEHQTNRVCNCLDTPDQEDEICECGCNADERKEDLVHKPCGAVEMESGRHGRGRVY
jgi:hypothetical protein